MTRRPERARPVIVLVVLVVALWFGVHAGKAAGTALVVSQPVSAEPDAIVSLASHEWERLPETAKAASRFPRAVVVLTLPEKVNKYNCHDCYRRVDRLAHAGVSKERVRIVPLVEGGTYGEALAVRRLVIDAGFTRILVVTSPYHTRRSLATFQSALPSDVEVGIEPASATSPSVPARWWAKPYDRAYVSYEWAGLIYYAARFRLS